MLWTQVCTYRQSGEESLTAFVFAADIAKGIPQARDWDNKMSDARRQIDWETMFALAIDGEKAQAYYESTPTEEKHSCSMCGKMCAVRTTNMILDGQSVSLRSEN